MTIVNRVGFLLDASSSMGSVSNSVRNRFSDLIRGVIASTPSEQRLEISIFSFSTPNMFNVLALNSDQRNLNIDDVLGKYHAIGPSTALKDSTIRAIDSMQTIRSMTKYSSSDDVSYLLYVITDGQDNSSITDTFRFSQRLKNLGEEWTVAIMVPSETDRRYAIQFGFDAGNIEVWNATSDRGVAQATASISKSYSDYSIMRSSGMKSSKSLFADLSKVSTDEVKEECEELNRDDFKLIAVQKESRIDDFVEEKTGKSYVLGVAFYELVKSELVHASKKLMILDKNTNRLYGGKGARQLLGLKNVDQRLRPGDHGKWRIFIQSTSVNRKLIPGQSVMIRV